MDKKYDLEEMRTIMACYAGSIEDKNEFKAHLELLHKWSNWSKREKLMGKIPTTEEIIELPQLNFNNISHLPLFLYFVLSHMRVSAIDLTETTISDFEELDELRGFLSENGMDFYEIVKLSHEAKISIIKSELSKQTSPENEAVYRIILNALIEKKPAITFSNLLVDSIPNCIQLLPVASIFIVSCQNLNNLSSLSKCYELQVLTIDSCDQLTTLSGLAELCSVNRYTLDSYKHLIKTPDKEYLNLADMSFIILDGINDPDSPQDQYSLKKNSNINSILINNCNNLIELTSLENCINLSALHINNCNKLNDIPSLNECIFLSDVVIENCNNIDRAHVEELNTRRQKTILTIDYFRNRTRNCNHRYQKIISEIHCIQDCTEEKKEKLKEIAKDINFSIFEQEIVAPNRVEEQAIGFSKAYPDGLTKLVIYDNDDLTNLEGLRWNDNIKLLSLEQLNKLENLRGIDKLPHLEELYLYNLKNLTSLAGLESLNKLRRLGLAAVNQLSDMKEFSKLPFLKQLLIEDQDGRISSLEGIEKAPSIEVLVLRDLSATTKLQALEQLPNLKMVLFFQKPAGDAGDNDAVLEHLKHLALPAGVKLLQMSYSSDMDDSRENRYWVELGCFNHQSQLASNMASMTEPEIDGLNGTVFVANQEFPLPPLSREYLEAQFNL